MENSTSKLDIFGWPRRERATFKLPHVGGIYALFLRSDRTLSGITPKEHGLIYIGYTNRLSSCCHFKSNTEDLSLRRSLAALLAPSLKLRTAIGANGNYKLDRQSEAVLSQWMHENLLMAFAIDAEPQRAEVELIARLAPPLNLTKCLQTDEHRELKRARKAMLISASA